MPFIPVCWRYAVSYPERDKGAPSPVTYASVDDVLACEYPDDAHFMGYSYPGVAHRLNIDALDVLPNGVTMVLFIADVDDPNTHGTKESSNQDWLTKERTKITALRVAHPESFVYETKGGYRVVFLLREPQLLRNEEDVRKWKIRYLLASASLYRRFGIVTDPSCRDWTRFYRLPHVVRDGIREDRPIYGDPRAMTSWTYEVLPEDEKTLDMLAAKETVMWGAARRSLDGTKAPREYDATRVVSEGLAWDRDSATVKEAIALLAKHFPARGRHHFTLALSGMLKNKEVKQDDAFDFVFQVCEQGGSDDPYMRAKNVLYTWKRVDSEGAATGYTTVVSIVGQDVAKKAGDLITLAVHEAWVYSHWGKRGKNQKLETLATSADAVIVATTDKSTDKKATNAIKDIKDLRKYATRLKSTKLKSNDVNRIIHGVLLHKFLNKEPLAFPVERDETTLLDRPTSISKLMGLLAFTMPVGTSWDYIKDLARDCISAMDTTPGVLDFWLEQAKTQYERSALTREFQLAQQKAKEEKDNNVKMKDIRVVNKKFEAPKVPNVPDVPNVPNIPNIPDIPVNLYV